MKTDHLRELWLSIQQNLQKGMLRLEETDPWIPLIKQTNNKVMSILMK